MPESHNPRVLLIDDDRALLRMARLALASDAMVVDTAADGVEGLEKLAAADFDVIVLDLQMPRMDGREFYREMRSRGYRTPVIILSAYGAETARKELGAECAVTKPFDPASLIRVVRSQSNGGAEQS
ncbi:MAG TPA: response regulator [Dehalococcoidia bacterium]|nr:response regulator [Dehalococcoidia bacterium]